MGRGWEASASSLPQATGWVTRCCVNWEMLLSWPSHLPPSAGGGTLGVCVQLQADRQLAGIYQQHVVTYFPFLIFLFFLSKAWFQDEEALLNQCDQHVPWIKTRQGAGGPRTGQQRKRSERGWSGFAHMSIANITWCWPHFPSKAQHHLQSCRQLFFSSDRALAGDHCKSKHMAIPGKPRAGQAPLQGHHT